jgi:hypothetical protein
MGGRQKLSAAAARVAAWRGVPSGGGTGGRAGSAEAIDLLTEGDRLTQHAGFAIRLQVFHSEREDHRAALACMDRIEERSPLMVGSPARTSRPASAMTPAAA